LQPASRDTERGDVAGERRDRAAEYAAFAASDWQALEEVWHPDIEYETFESAPDAGTYRGLDEATRLFDSWRKTFPELRVEVDEIVEVGDRVVVVERPAGRGIGGSDAEAWLEQSFARVISFKDGRIWRVKEYRTLDEALEAAGLEE
jgi:ketosteroid isomerase-like protein